MNNFNFTMIVKVLRVIFIGIITLNIISHNYILISIQKSIFDIQNILSLLLILSFIFVNRATTVFLIFYCFNILSMIFFPKLFSENIYYTFFLGQNLSSYIRLNITNTYWIVNLIMNLSFYLVGYIIFLEIPFRLYKRKLFPFNKKS
ncbi:hypothetical protein SAMN05421593_0330 [Chryseobacterium culicis]|uniref:Uncharacterized protein n=1 Tax=Chryseobacterium culicis TaxID=680127 RepID=A0A1H6GVV6_CHRCI|nr:hypothetical protein SAMN05421593_0330 [Chryseobacterium culicis]